ncbi:hypothetical protein [Prevotella bivia]|uniref:hypothetical protein n=1 Tax=Prevotella bivia TaxID=28125 RepID=UPI0009B84179|nr:hypothetical protein [Prevotella bivia]
MRRIKMNIKGDAQKESVSPERFFDQIMDIAENKRMEILERHKIRPLFTIYKIEGDGHRIVATSPADFLHQLRTGSRFDSQGTDNEYMVRFAHRLQELEGYLVSTASPEAFLADLIAHGFVVEE